MAANAHEVRERGVELVAEELRARGVRSVLRSPVPGIHLTAKATTGHEINVVVRTNLKPKPGGGKGKLALDWWIPDDIPTDVVALVDLSTRRIWMLRIGEVPELAQQYSNGRYHLYMYVDHTAALRVGNYDTDFERHLLANRIGELFAGGY